MMTGRVGAVSPLSIDTAPAGREGVRGPHRSHGCGPRFREGGCERRVRGRSWTSSPVDLGIHFGATFRLFHLSFPPFLSVEPLMTQGLWDMVALTLGALRR